MKVVCPGVLAKFALKFKCALLLSVSLPNCVVDHVNEAPYRTPINNKNNLECLGLAICFF